MIESESVCEKKKCCRLAIFLAARTIIQKTAIIEKLSFDLFQFGQREVKTTES